MTTSYALLAAVLSNGLWEKCSYSCLYSAVTTYLSSVHHPAGYLGRKAVGWDGGGLAHPSSGSSPATQTLAILSVRPCTSSSSTNLHKVPYTAPQTSIYAHIWQFQDCPPPRLPLEAYIFRHTRTFSNLRFLVSNLLCCYRGDSRKCHAPHSWQIHFPGQAKWHMGPSNDRPSFGFVATASVLNRPRKRRVRLSPSCIFTRWSEMDCFLR